VTGVVNGLLSVTTDVTVFRHCVPHTPPTHTRLDVHATAGPHWPHPLQVSTPVVPEHCVVPGLQTGAVVHEQAPQAQLVLQDCVPYVLQVCVPFGAQAPWPGHEPLVCQAPLALQLCVSVPQLPQATAFVWPGAQTPVQVPDTQVVFTHPTALPQDPEGSHVSTPLPEQRVAAGEHDPVHIPEPVQTYVQRVPAFCQAPASLHACGWAPLHCAAPGEHARQLPALQTLAHVAPPSCHVPELSHVSGCRPLHCIDPGEQTPTQLPALQVVVQVVPSCSVPVGSHVSGVGPLHSLVPGVQLPEQTPPSQTYWQADPKDVQTALELHTCGCKSAHPRVPGVHTPTASLLPSFDASPPCEAASASLPESLPDPLLDPEPPELEPESVPVVASCPAVLASPCSLRPPTPRTSSHPASASKHASAAAAAAFLSRGGRLRIIGWLPWPGYHSRQRQGRASGP